jgi:UDP-N-acetylmuramoyl-L-alanyl-D-glutamate--2,6-diaminopimelate ligase
VIELKDILYKVTLNAVVGSTSLAIKAIEFDSRNVNAEDVFVAVKGSAV